MYRLYRLYRFILINYMHEINLAQFIIAYGQFLKFQQFSKVFVTITSYPFN